MIVGPDAIKTGMQVGGPDGQGVGQVKEVRRFDFPVDRAMAMDVYVPFGAGESVNDNQVVLNVPASQVQHIGWATPQISSGTPSPPSHKPPESSPEHHQVTQRHTEPSLARVQDAAGGAGTAIELRECQSLDQCSASPLCPCDHPVSSR